MLIFQSCVCQTGNIVPFTFPTVAAHLELTGYDVDVRLRVSFDFRSYNRDGMLFLHVPNPGTTGRFTVGSQLFVKLYLNQYDSLHFCIVSKKMTRTIGALCSRVTLLGAK